MQPLIPDYFSADEVEVLRALEGHLLEQVVYTVWRNVARPDEPFSALEWVTFSVGEGLDISFTAGAESEAIRIETFDFVAENARISDQFRGQVVLEQIVMDQSPIWKDLVGMPLISVQMDELDANLYLNHVLVFEIGPGRIEMSLGEEGLILRRIN